MSYSVPGVNQRFDYHEPNKNTQYVIDRAFEQITAQAFNTIIDQLVEYGRPYEWMQVFGPNPQKSRAYEECLDIWSVLIDDNGRFSAAGLMIANCMVDPDSTLPSLETYIAEKFGLDAYAAFSVSSLAMWDLIMLRGLPANHDVPNA